MKPYYDAAMFAESRRLFLDALSEGHAALLFAPKHHHRNSDTEYRYRQSSDLYYLTGWEDPEAAVLVRPGAEEPVVMFVQPRNKEMETWTGRRPGPEGAVEDYGADAAHPIGELAKRLPELLLGYHTLHYQFAEDADHDKAVAKAVYTAGRKARKTRQDVPHTIVDPRLVLHELRLRKRPEELELLREASRITVEAHLAAMAMTAPGVFEYQLESEIEHTFRKQGGNGPGYPSIVGGGVNATILHYNTNHQELRDGDLVCVDAGCEYAFYTADVTRTWPVNGKFSEAQAELYQLVLDAQLAAIELIRPGTPWKDIHDVATKILTTGMVELGLLGADCFEAKEDEDEAVLEELRALEGEALVDALIEREVHKRYYMHGTGHWLGLDVHDVGLYHRGGESRMLEPGMLMTVEPGLYIPEDDDRAPERYRGIGLRIEDDVLCTEDAPEVLTAAAPKRIAEVEAAVGTALSQAAK